MVSKCSNDEEDPRARVRRQLEESRLADQLDHLLAGGAGFPPVWGLPSGEPSAFDALDPSEPEPSSAEVDRAERRLGGKL